MTAAIKSEVQDKDYLPAFAKAFKNYYCSKLDTIQHYTVKSIKFDPYFGRKMKASQVK